MRNGQRRDEANNNNNNGDDNDDNQGQNGWNGNQFHFRRGNLNFISLLYRAIANYKQCITNL